MPLLVLTFNDEYLVDCKTMNKSTYSELACAEAYNDSKFYGSICHECQSNPIIIIPNVLTLLTKKGSLPFNFHFSNRLPSISFQYMLVCDKKKADFKKNSNEEKLYNLSISSGYKIVSSEEFKEMYEELKKVHTPFSAPVAKYTCGLNAHYDNNNQLITGHCTRGYGINSDTCKTLETENSIHYEKIYNGLTLDLTISNKPGGKVIYIPELGGTSHLTINTPIKAALSGPIVQKYLDNVFEFALKDIDSVAKVDQQIIVTKGTEVQVTIKDWYQYII